MISIIKINNINYKGNCSPIHGPITVRRGGERGRFLKPSPNHSKLDCSLGRYPLMVKGKQCGNKNVFVSSRLSSVRRGRLHPDKFALRP